MIKYTRKQYMAKECTHREYYAQFVDEDVKRHILRFIGLKALIRSRDEYLNDIPLKQWDLAVRIMPYSAISKLRQANESGGHSLSDLVCVAKEAAHQIIEETRP